MNKARLILSAVRTGIVVALAVFIVIRISSARHGLRDAFKSAFGHRDQITMLEGVIEDIRPIKELTTARYDAEITVIRQNPDNGASSVWDRLLSKGAEDVYIVKGEVRAGIDFNDITVNSLSISGDTLYVQMPEVKILDIIVNPSGITVFDDAGTPAHAGAVMEFAREAKTELAGKALTAGILRQARESALNTLTQMFLSSGFGTVVVTEPPLTPTTDPIPLPVER